jgi:hypothetical protein
LRCVKKSSSMTSSTDGWRLGTFDEWEALVFLVCFGILSGKSSSLPSAASKITLEFLGLPAVMF